MLDLEGNCIKNSRQLHYLRRLRKLEDLNLCGNPVKEQASNQLEYYQILKDSCENLQTLDDECVSPDFYD